MDAIWIILDSLSFESTPFHPSGPNTMPELEKIASENGVIFTEAYSPGPTSPSSHGSFYTGKYPSQTGMTEASPYYSASYPTIIEKLADSHRSYVISANPFIFNGLDRGLDEEEDLVSDQYMVFDEATNPREVEWNDEESKIDHYRRVIFEDGKPIRSFINGVNAFIYQRKNEAAIPSFAKNDQEMYQYSTTMNEKIREFQRSTNSDTFVIANYMDIHAPLDASDEAIARFSSKSRDELPVGVSGQEIHRQVSKGNTELGEDMYNLYLATIYDTDRKISGLVRDLIENDTFVVITADHGNWFRREEDLEQRRIHVPLIIFSPTEYEHRVVDHTVNLRSLPRTTMEAVRGESGGFEGVNLLSVDEDQLSVTEYIHDSDVEGSPVTPTGKANARYDFTLVKGNNRLDYIGGKLVSKDGDEEAIDELEEIAKDLLNQDFASSNESMDMDQTTQQRLKDLGYLN